MSQFVHPNDALRLKLSAFSSSSILSPSPAAAPLRESWGQTPSNIQQNLVETNYKMADCWSRIPSSERGLKQNILNSPPTSKRANLFKPQAKVSSVVSNLTNPVVFTINSSSYRVFFLPIWGMWVATFAGVGLDAMASIKSAPADNKSLTNATSKDLCLQGMPRKKKDPW